MNFYIASGLDNAPNVAVLRDMLTRRGHCVTYDWTQHGLVHHLDAWKIAEVAKGEALGVVEADMVIVLMPGGRGTHTELGIALGAALRGDASVRIVLCGPRVDDKGRTCAFYYHNKVRWCDSSDPADVLKYVAEEFGA